MHRLSCPPARDWFERLSGRRPQGERGVAAVIAAALLSGGLLFSMGALVIDVGQLYNEREQLQTAADAASWALAQNCAASATKSTCGSQLSLAQSLANSDSADGASAIKSICGYATGLTACTADPVTSQIPPCQGSLPASPMNYIEVRTSTKQSDGTTVLPPVFAGLANSANTGSTLSACSRVAWGRPAL